MTDLNSARQQADDDLTWLARNVHRWIDGDYLIRVSKISYTFRERCEGETVLPEWHTRDQWLARRAELQNKPDWGEVESDAEWVAQHPNGRWAFFKHKPTPCIDGGCWRFNGAYSWRSKNVGEVLGDWRDTLENRPKNNIKSMSGVHSHGDMASLLNELDDNDSAKSGPSSDDWHKRGERPPVGACVLKKLKSHCDNWREVTIAGAGNQLVILRYQDGVEVVGGWNEYDFRPIRTERERVAAELVDVMMAVPVSDRKTASESYMSMALAIYDHLNPESRV